MIQAMVEAKIGKKFAVYLPKSVVEALDLKEGDRVLLMIKGDEVAIKKRGNFFKESLQRRKILKISPEEAEKASLEMQREFTEG